jgi:hypothetical protein
MQASLISPSLDACMLGFSRSSFYCVGALNFHLDDIVRLMMSLCFLFPTKLAARGTINLQTKTSPEALLPPISSPPCESDTRFLSPWSVGHLGSLDGFLTGKRHQYGVVLPEFPNVRSGRRRGHSIYSSNTGRQYTPPSLLSAVHPRQWLSSLLSSSFRRYDAVLNAAILTILS